jgi:glycosyltransferase involved in cell wall biosynthesis
MDRLVSVIVPCYNAGSYVADTIRSVLNQTLGELELIVVDSGSQDSSRQIIRDLAGDKRLMLVPLERKDALSAAAARNEGLRRARGEYIKFMDADDVIHPEMLERQLERLRGREDCVASSEWGRFYNNNLSTYTPSRQSVWRDMDAREWLVESWMDARPMTQCGMFLVPRPVLDRVGGWDERLTLIDDFEFFARVMCEARDVLFTPGCPMHYRSGVSGSLSGTKSDRAIESAYLSASAGVDHLLAKRSDERAKRACANIMQDFAYTFYPARPDLTIQAERRARELGGADVEPGGGRKFHLARRLLGWKTARRLVG